jgi:tetratricopeptide (TPR) repeat protein
MKGPLEPGVVPDVLRSIYLGRRTGMLRFIRGEERLSVRFMSGHIVYGEASVKELRLGEVLVASGKLEAAVFDAALAVVLRDRKRMGAVLMEMGVLDENGIEEALALQVRTILARVFSLHEGTYTFQEQDPEAFLDDDWPLAISTAEAVLAAVRAVASEDDVRFALGSLDRVLIGSDDPLVLYQRMDLGAEEGAVIARVNGILPAREVLLRTGLPLAVAERSLLALLCTGILEYAAGPATPADAPAPAELRQEILGLYEGLGRRSDHELLGVAPGASAADLKAAYFRLAKRYHPDVFREPGLADLRAKVEAVFFRVNDAYRALSAPAPRAVPAARSGPAAEAPARPGDAFGFEEMLAQGRRLLTESKAWEAAALFESVANGADGRMRTRARVLLGRALLQLPDREKAAEKHLLAAAKDDPAHVEAHYLLGTLYRRRGLGTRAASMFRRALEIDPAHRAALAEMDALEKGPPPAAPPGRAPRRT